MRRKWRENTQNSRNRRRMAHNTDLCVGEILHLQPLLMEPIIQLGISKW